MKAKLKSRSFYEHKNWTTFSDALFQLKVYLCKWRVKLVWEEKKRMMIAGEQQVFAFSLDVQSHQWDQQNQFFRVLV